MNDPNIIGSLHRQELFDLLHSMMSAHLVSIKYTGDDDEQTKIFSYGYCAAIENMARGVGLVDMSTKLPLISREKLLKDS